MEVQVLGTTFNVNARNESPSVYLESGQVVLHTHGDMVTLQPGDRADYKKTTKKVEIKKESLENASVRLAWRNNLYIMNDFQLTSIARDIEDNFGKRVIITDSTLATKRVTAKVPSRDIDVLLKVLSETLDIEIEQNANQIIINPRKKAD
jgi:ferric-dicitrate binding protein FerR (iron transport regulator)